MKSDMNESVTTRGDVELIIDYTDNRPQEIHHFKNAILTKGRQALAKGLANDIGDGFDFYVSRMIFGSNGTTGGVKKFVNSDRNALFGSTILSKPVVASRVDTQVIFTSVVASSEAVGAVINEMALQLNNGDLYSMVTRADLNKTAQMQLTWNWRITMI